MWVMPSSSARCAQLPRAEDKVPHYRALKRFRDYLNKEIKDEEVNEADFIFPDPKLKTELPKADGLLSNNYMNANPMGLMQQTSDMTDISGSMLGDDVPGKKKRGRPKKVRGEGEDGVKMAAPRRQQNTSYQSEFSNGDTPKKKRGRPKKVKDGSSSKMSTNTNLENSLTNNNSGTGSVTPDGCTPALYSPSVNKCNSLPQQQQSQSQQPPQQQQQSLNLFSSSSNLNLTNNFCGLGDSPYNQNMPSNHQSTPYLSHGQRLLHQSHHHQTNTSSPQQFSHSELSSDISAAISTGDHLSGNVNNNSPSPSTRSLAPADFEPVRSAILSGENTSTTTTVTTKSNNNMTSSSESSTPTTGLEHLNRIPSHLQQSNSSCYSPYRNTPPTSNYLSESHHQTESNHSFIQRQNDVPAGDPSRNDLNIHNLIGDHHGHRQEQQQQQQQTQQQTQQQPSLQGHRQFQPQSHHTTQRTSSSDVTTKSLSGLESLVDQIPSLRGDNTDTSSPQTPSLHNIRTENRLNEIDSLTGSEHQFPNSCLYSSNYPSATGQSLGNSMLGNIPEIGLNPSRNRSADLSGSATPNNLMSHYSNYPHSPIITPSGSSLHSPNSVSSHTPSNTPSSNNQSHQSSNSYSLNSPFSVSSLTAVGNHHNYSPTPSSSVMNPYHPNLMSSFNNPMYPLVGMPIYPSHGYSQHHHPGFSAGYSNTQHPNFQQAQQQHQHLQAPAFSSGTSPTIHVPSPNYPPMYFGSGAASIDYGHPQSAGHHHPAASYLTNHSFYDRTKQDIGSFSGL